MCNENQSFPEPARSRRESQEPDAVSPMHEIRHFPPQMPLFIDGSEEDPRAIGELNGVPLHYVMDEHALAGNRLSVFTTSQAAERHCLETLDQALAPDLRNRALAELKQNLLEATSRPEPLPADSQLVSSPLLVAAYPPGGVPLGRGYVDLYEHVNWGGCRWRLLEWEKTAWNLRDVEACGFLWWGEIDASRKVSCIDAQISGQRPMLVLADQPNLGGSWYWIPGRSFVPSLVPHGWNDRARSVMIMYFS